MNHLYFADNIDIMAFGHSPEDGPFGVYSDKGQNYPLISGPFNTYEEADAVADELNDARN